MPILTENELITICVLFSFTLTIVSAFIFLPSLIGLSALFFTFFILSCMSAEVYVKYQSKIKNETVKQILIINEGFLEGNRKIYNEEDAIKNNIISETSKKALSKDLARKYISLKFEGDKLVMNINKVNSSDLSFCKKMIFNLQQEFGHSTIMVNGKDINEVMLSDTSLEYQCQKDEKTIIETMLH